MKLTPELKNRIDFFFDNITGQELFDLSVNEYGFVECEHEDQTVLSKDTVSKEWKCDNCGAIEIENLSIR